MDIYLVQHGLAVSEEQDPQRPLSEVGRKSTERVANYLSERRERLIDRPISAVLHSGKSRARQTAEILAKALAPTVTPESCANMNPSDDANIIYHQLMADYDREAAILLTGHLPHLSQLSGLLLAGDAERTPVRFVNSGVLKIGANQTSWAVEWYITPEMAC